MASPSVAETLDGKVLLLTGASGFVGRALLEKLLRTCPNLERIYVVLRASRAGAPPGQRLRDMLQEPMFDAVRASPLGARLEEVVTAVAGDCAAEGLGLAAADRDLLQAEVDVVVHAAASVRFDDSMQRAVLLNARGAREVAALALAMPRLKVLVHVSTTYCNTHQPVIEERVYPMPDETRADWQQILQIAEKLDEKQMETMVRRGYQPNTYTFSKALAEQVVADHSDRLNVAIFRPSIVTGAVAEPMPGWAANLNGPFALCVGITKGIVRTYLADKEACIDVVPVEVVVNGIILAVREGIINSASGPGLRVYNCSAANRKTLSVCESIECALKSNADAPHDRTLWHPFLVTTSSLPVFTMLTVLLHFVPAVFVDLGTWLVGRKPWLMRTYWKVYRATVSLRYFSLTHWEFKNEQFYALRRTLDAQDFATFKLDYSEIDEVQYVHTHLQYLRRYILKEDMDHKKAKRNQTIMYALDRCTRVLLLYFLVSFAFRVLQARQSYPPIEFVG